MPNTGPTVDRRADHVTGIPPVTSTGIVNHVPGITGHVQPESLPGFVPLNR